MRPISLQRRIFALTALAIVVVICLTVFVLAAVGREEANEQRDEALRELAPFAAAMVSDPAGSAPALDRMTADGWVTRLDGHEPFFGIGLFDADGALLLDWKLPEVRPDPAELGTGRFWNSDTHRFYIGKPDRNGQVIVLADSFDERQEAFSESLAAIAWPMLPLVLVALLLVSWVARAALRPLDTLRAEIARRDTGTLDPIDAGPMPAELRPLVTALNGFMSRLLTALDSERQFAANAAHELRTPLALALARLQRIEAGNAAAQPAQIAELRQSIKRMTRTVERLLHLARAESGPDRGGETCDMGEVLDHLLHERAVSAEAARLSLSMPGAPVTARIGMDDFGIIAANLIDNALQHAPSDAPVQITLTPDGQLCVANPGPVIPMEDLRDLKTRYKRRDRRGGGLGLGLYIVDTLARKSGGTLTLHSPIRGDGEGVEAVLQLPLDD